MLLRIENVCYSYKKRVALENICLEISEKGLDVFLGHNGAGKTTLFLLISGHLKLQSGFIEINKHFVTGRKEVAFVPETGGFFESLSPIENLKFRYLLSEQPEEQMLSKIEKMVAIFGLREHSRMPGCHLSSGLKKRLALACALICKPKLLLLDEPTNGIDPVTKDLLVRILKHLNADGIKVLLNSHDLEFVSEVADNITILNNKRVYLHLCNQSEVDRDELKRIYLRSMSTEEELFNESF